MNILTNSDIIDKKKMSEGTERKNEKFEATLAQVRWVRVATPPQIKRILLLPELVWSLPLK